MGFPAVLAMALMSTTPMADENASRNDRANMTVDQVVKRFIEYLKPDRFDHPYQMVYDLKYSPAPDLAGAPFGVVEYTHQVKQPRHRTQTYFKTRENPSSYIAIYNGESQVTLRGGSDPPSIIVKRNGSDNPLVFENNFLFSLGVPVSPEHKEAALKEREPFLLGITEKNGYGLDPDLRDLDGAPCHVIRKGSSDILWFDSRDGVKLVKRETQSNKSPFRKVEFRFGDYRDDHFPHYINRYIYNPTQDIKAPSSIQRRLEFTLSKLSFEEPADDAFILEARPGTDVLDVDSRQSFRVQQFGDSPFKELIRIKSLGQSRITNPRLLLIVANILLVVVLVVLIRLRSRRRAGA